MYPKDLPEKMSGVEISSGGLTLRINRIFLKTILLTLFCAVLLFCSCSKPRAFEYRDIKNFKVQTMGYNNTALLMDLVYYNPNGFGVDLRRVDCDVYVDNTYLGKFQLDTLMHISRRAEFVLPSKIVVDMKTIFKNGLNMLFSREVLVNVKGTTRVGKAGIFATVPFNYEARHTLSLF